MGGPISLRVLDDERAVRSFVPDYALLKALSCEHGCEPGSLLITSLADAAQPYDVVSRMFAPLFGIPEDPATGSAHSVLMPLFARLTGRDRLRFHQAFPGRSDLECELVANRVLLRGSARTLLRAELDLSGLISARASEAIIGKGAYARTRQA
jgi:predicted PhzF superfamily epimerase YddE/YHI9